MLLHSWQMQSILARIECYSGNHAEELKFPDIFVPVAVIGVTAVLFQLVLTGDMNFSNEGKYNSVQQCDHNGNGNADIVTDVVIRD